MQIPVITQLTKTQTPARLKAAETALLAYQQPDFEVVGHDICEQLTHVLVAQVLLDYMREHDASLPAAVRAFGQRVRTCITPS